MVAALAAVGCAQTRTYDLAVRNDLDKPVTVCLTKAGGPAEPGWESPEELAGPDHPASDEQPPGVVVPPGKTASPGEMSGEFYGGGLAVLRVYAGTPSLNQMNAISRDSPDRVDWRLHTGVSRLVVRRADDGRLVVAPAGAAPRPTGS